MLRTATILIGVIATGFSVPALADPVGRYRVVGQGPDGGDRYEGTVDIVRRGELYAISWKIGADRFTGTGIGAHPKNGLVEFGPASTEDVVIAISYRAGQANGTANYVLGADGQWTGAWAYEGADRASYETWFPLERKSTSRTTVTVKEKSQPVPGPVPMMEGPKSN